MLLVVDVVQQQLVVVVVVVVAAALAVLVQGSVDEEMAAPVSVLGPLVLARGYARTIRYHHPHPYPCPYPPHHSVRAVPRPDNPPHTSQACSPESSPSPQD